MEMQNIKNEFIEMNMRLSEEERKLEKKFSRISALRVISFLLAAALLLVGIADRVWVAGIAGGVFLLFFVFLIKCHGDVVYKSEVTKSRRQAVKRYQKRFSDEWRRFEEDGRAYLSEDNTVASDIDLLGSDSLYQLINVCHTDYGKRALAESMKLEKPDFNGLAGRREAVEELMRCRDFAVRYEGAGIRLEGRKKKFNAEEFEEYCRDGKRGMLSGWAEALRFVLPAVWLVLFLLWILGLLGYGFWLAGFAVILSFSWLTKGMTDSVILPVYSVGYALDDYMDMMEELERADFHAELLCGIRDGICGKNGAIHAFRGLKSISQAYNISFNPLVHQLMSGILLWDYQLAHVVSKWKKRYGGYAADCFGLLGRMEELLSLAVIGMVRETGWAEIAEGEDDCRLSCEDLYHPLIAPEKVQGNSVELKSGITIITGSNMSGKTTFLRTVAINLALAYMGAPICGKSLRAGYMKIFTSMRITDDVANGISTFYAEILRIKGMAEYRKKNRAMLCLIDEIFKGTNSSDRIVGAKEVITGLAGERCMTIVSTHDFELCSLTDREGRTAENYHFEEHYENNELRFDYKIKDGRCTTTNARAILRMAGFDVPDEK